MFILLIIIKILIYLLIFLLGMVLLLLIIPFNYKGQVLTADGIRLQLVLDWAWELLGINAEIQGEAYDITFNVLNKRVYKFKSKAGGEKEEEPQKTNKEEKDTKEKKGFNLNELADRRIINEILEYFKQMLNLIKPKYFHLYGTYGFDDPSLTGSVCGVAVIIKSMIPHARLQLTPDFTQEIFDVDLCVKGSMVAASAAYQTIRIAFKKPLREILFRKKKN